jgi:CBS domain containing-hemolysin-like protein
LSVQLEDEDVDTLGGYVYAKLGRVPEEGDEIEAGNVRLVVHAVEGNRITRVRVLKNEVPEDAQTDPSEPLPAP